MKQLSAAFVAPHWTQATLQSELTVHTRAILEEVAVIWAWEIFREPPPV